jgi:hypothetical protein
MNISQKLRNWKEYTWRSCILSFYTLPFIWERCGKSILLFTLRGMDETDSGEVCFTGKALWEM